MTTSDGAYQVVMDGVGAYSAPYTDRQKAGERAEELGNAHTDSSFHVEDWPNHRQEDTESDER